MGMATHILAQFCYGIVLRPQAVDLESLQFAGLVMGSNARYAGVFSQALAMHQIALRVYAISLVAPLVLTARRSSDRRAHPRPVARLALDPMPSTRLAPAPVLPVAPAGRQWSTGNTLPGSPPAAFCRPLRRTPSAQLQCFRRSSDRLSALAAWTPLGRHSRAGQAPLARRP